MAETFADFVRSGRLQKNFDDAVQKAAEEAKQRGLRRAMRTPEVGNDSAVPAPARDKTFAPLRPGEE